MKKVFAKSMVVLTVLSSSAFAQEQMKSSTRNSVEIESSCRIKAKEIAADTYRTCVSDQKNSQIEQIKKEYAAKLQALKAHYEAELKKLSGKGNKAEKIEKSDDSLSDSAVQSENGGMNSGDDVVQPEAVQVEEIKTEPVVEESQKVEAPMVRVQKPSPTKKATQKPTAKVIMPKKTVASRNSKVIKAEKQILANKLQEMTLHLKPSPKSMIRDASGELPEPIPVETTQDSAI